MSGPPGRASSLASVGLLFALCVFGAVLGEQQSANRTQAVLFPAHAAPTTVHNLDQPRDQKGPDPTATTTVPLVTENFRCPKPTGPAGVQRGTHLISSSQHGLVLLADTFCRDSTWYVSARISGRISVDAAAFRVPDDPPVPTAVTAERFIPLGGSTLPAALVLREPFPGASLYELFTVVGRYVEPMVLSPGSSPVLLLSGVVPAPRGRVLVFRYGVQRGDQSVPVVRGQSDDIKDERPRGCSRKSRGLLRDNRVRRKLCSFVHSHDTADRDEGLRLSPEVERRLLLSSLPLLGWLSGL